MKKSIDECIKEYKETDYDAEKLFKEFEEIANDGNKEALYYLFSISVDNNLNYNGYKYLLDYCDSKDNIIKVREEYDFDFVLESNDSKIIQRNFELIKNLLIANSKLDTPIKLIQNENLFFSECFKYFATRDAKEYFEFLLMIKSLYGNNLIWQKHLAYALNRWLNDNSSNLSQDDLLKALVYYDDSIEKEFVDLTLKTIEQMHNDNFGDILNYLPTRIINNPSVIKTICNRIFNMNDKFFADLLNSFKEDSLNNSSLCDAICSKINKINDQSILDKIRECKNIMNNGQCKETFKYSYSKFSNEYLEDFINELNSIEDKKIYLKQFFMLVNNVNIQEKLLKHYIESMESYTGMRHFLLELKSVTKDEKSRNIIDICLKEIFIESVDGIVVAESRKNCECCVVIYDYSEDRYIRLISNNNSMAFDHKIIESKNIEVLDEVRVTNLTKLKNHNQPENYYFEREISELRILKKKINNELPLDKKQVIFYDTNYNITPEKAIKCKSSFMICEIFDLKLYYNLGKVQASFKYNGEYYKNIYFTDDYRKKLNQIPAILKSNTNEIIECERVIAGFSLGEPSPNSNGLDMCYKFLCTLLKII